MRCPCDLISVDSVLVYRGMDIGSAKPDRATLARYPHQLIDIRDPAEAYSAAEFREDALVAIQQAADRGRLPVLVGGTSMYYRRFCQGGRSSQRRPGDSETPSKMRPRPWDGRRCMCPIAGTRSGRRSAYSSLKPATYQRALEVIELSGKPMSSFWNAAESTGTGEAGLG